MGLIAARMRQVAWAAIAQLSSVAGLLLALKLIALHTDPAVYGAYAMGIAVSGTVTLLLFGPISQLVMRYYSSIPAGDRSGDLVSVVATYYLLALLVVGGLLAAAVAVMWALGQWRYVGVAVLGCALGCASGSNMILIGAANAAGRHRVIAITTLVDQSARVGALAALFAFTDRVDADQVLGVYSAAACTISLVLCLRPEITWGSVATTPVRLRPAASQSASRRPYVEYLQPFLVFAWFAAIGAYADRYLLQFNCGAQCVGIYAAAYTIANGGVVLASNVITQVLVPVVFRERAGSADDVASRAMGQAALALAAAIAGGALLGFALGDWIIATFASHAFLESARYLWILVVCYGIFQLGQLFTIYGLVRERSRQYVAPKAVHAALVALLGALLVPAAGIWGMIGALLVSATVYAAMTFRIQGRSA